MKYILLSICCSLTFNLLFSQAGTLVADFGDDGVIFRDISPDSYDVIDNVIELEDGSILGTGFISTFDQPDQGNSLISKYDANGSLIFDLQFDGSSQGLRDYILASVRLGNSFLTCTMFNDESFGGLRLSLNIRKWNLDGTLDTSFGDNGEVVITRNDIDLEIYDMQVDDANRIYLIGATHFINGRDIDAMVIRLIPGGTVDESYADNGYFIKNWNVGQARFNEGIIIQEELYLAGNNTSTITNRRAIFAKLTETGVLDNGFGDDGRVTFSNDFISASSLAQQGSNHIILSGQYESNDFIGVSRFDLNGNVDNTFGQNGITILDFGDTEIPRDLVIDIDNAIYVGGYTNLPRDFSLMHLNEDGSIDEAFANNGIATYDVNGDDYLSEIILLHNGNVIMCGENESALPNSIIIMKVLGVNGCLNVVENIMVEACDEVIYDGNSYPSGEYQFIFDNNGCDSIVNLTVVVNESSNTFISLSGCDSVLYNDQWIKTSATFVDVVPASNGCDSTISTDIEITSIVAEIEFVNGILRTNSIASSYQWIDCSTNTPIDGANSQTFTPLVSGSYALAFNEGDCTKTSSCLEVGSTSTKNLELLNIHIYPNPVADFLIIDNPNANQIKSYRIFNNQGAILKSFSSDTPSHKLDVADLNNGIYYLEIVTSEGVLAHHAFVKF